MLQACLRLPQLHGINTKKSIPSLSNLLSSSRLNFFLPIFLPSSHPLSLLFLSFVQPPPPKRGCLLCTHPCVCVCVCTHSCMACVSRYVCTYGCMWMRVCATTMRMHLSELRRRELRLPPTAHPLNASLGGWMECAYVRETYQWSEESSNVRWEILPQNGRCKDPLPVLISYPRERERGGRRWEKP